MESEAQPTGHPDNGEETGGTGQGPQAPLFSIVLPVHNYKQVWRAICSALNQTFDDYELIIVDDACDDGTERVIEEYVAHPKVTVIRHEERQERLISRNHGMGEATGTWIQPLDRDDELASIALECWKHHIDMNPEYRVMNCAALMHDRKPVPMPDGTERRFYFWSHRRQVFRPPLLDVGHEHFDCENPEAQFIFANKALDDVEFYPDAFSACQFAHIDGIPPRTQPDGEHLGEPLGRRSLSFLQANNSLPSLPLDSFRHCQLLP